MPTEKNIYVANSKTINESEDYALEFYVGPDGSLMRIDSLPNRSKIKQKNNKKPRVQLASMWD